MSIEVLESCRKKQQGKKTYFEKERHVGRFFSEKFVLKDGKGHGIMGVFMGDFHELNIFQTQNLEKTPF